MKNQTLHHYLVNLIVRTANAHPDCSISENALTIADLKKDLSSMAQYCSRNYHHPDSKSFMSWFSYDDSEKSGIIKAAREDAENLISR